MIYLCLSLLVLIFIAMRLFPNGHIKLGVILMVAAPVVLAAMTLIGIQFGRGGTVLGMMAGAVLAVILFCFGAGLALFSWWRRRRHLAGTTEVFGSSE